MPSLVLPGLAAAGVSDLHETPFAGGRLWRDRPRADGMLVLVPDLSRDVVLGDGAPALVRRTIRRTEVPVSRGADLTGLRLPIAATEISVDATWSGWRHRGDRQEELLAEAVTAGAISWREDQLLARFLELGDRPEARVAALAAELGISERTLRRHCVDLLGLPPVAVLRILRMWRLAARLRSEDAAAAAAGAGYADQSHAGRDVRAIAGMTLRDLAAFRLAA